MVEISRQVQNSNDVAADAVKQANPTDERMAELSAAGDRIGDAVKLITSIAEQATSGEMLGSAQALSEVSIHLQDETEKFLDSVRAA